MEENEPVVEDVSPVVAELVESVVDDESVEEPVEESVVEEVESPSAEVVESVVEGSEELH